MPVTTTGATRLARSETTSITSRSSKRVKPRACMSPRRMSPVPVARAVERRALARRRGGARDLAAFPVLVEGADRGAHVAQRLAQLELLLAPHRDLGVGQRRRREDGKDGERDEQLDQREAARVVIR